MIYSLRPGLWQNIETSHIVVCEIVRMAGL